MLIHIGTYHEREARELNRCPGYYAADYETHLTIPGDYPVFMDFVSGYTIPMPYWLLYSIKSRVTGGRLFNGFGGLNFSSQEIEPHDSHYPVQTYDYTLKTAVEKGYITVFPDWAWLAGEHKDVIEHVRNYITWETLRTHEYKKETQ